MLPKDLYWQEERVGRSHRAIVSQTLKAASSDVIEEREGGRVDRMPERERERVWGRSSSSTDVIGPWGVASRGAKRKRVT